MMADGVEAAEIHRMLPFHATGPGSEYGSVYGPYTGPSMTLDLHGVEYACGGGGGLLGYVVPEGSLRREGTGQIGLELWP